MESQPERLARATREADMLEKAARLARASGCPEGESILPWCEARGLIAPDGLGGFVLTAKASMRRVVP